MAPVRSWFQRLWSQEKRIWSDERRYADRQTMPPLIAYYFDGSAPVPHTVRNVSPAGMYLETEQRWYPNTVIKMTLVRTDKLSSDPHRSLEVLCRVDRAAEDGVGLAFVLPDSAKEPNEDEDEAGVLPTTDEETLRAFLPPVESDGNHHGEDLGHA